MNYPLWGIPAPGLVIAVIATIHVFISHFAVGGGLFLVLLEKKARRENDAALLDHARGLSRFFVLVTLVSGAVTGVGIWFAIGLVSPAATSSLINTFVWGWAIEWTMFVTEIAAALVYVYGWERLSPAQHVRVGWVYFWAAWLSLVVINGILTYMLTPGGWLETRGFWAAIFNPTYFPALLARTAACFGLAGMYALLVAGRSGDAGLKAKVAHWSVTRWIVPAAIVLPASLAWFVVAAGGAGIPVRAIAGSAQSGQPIVQRALITTGVAAVAMLALSFVALARRRAYGTPLAVAIMATGFVALAGGEWVREGLRKPYVITGYMYVNGLRVDDVASHERESILAASQPWVVVPAEFDPDKGVAATVSDVAQRVAIEDRAGAEVFRTQCAACHSTDGYLAIRPLVAGQKVATLQGMLDKLDTWRGRRMPAFRGSDAERHALAVHLARLGGAGATELAAASAAAAGGAGDKGKSLFEAQCAMCHANDAEWPIGPRIAGRDEAALYDTLGKLPELNDAMPPFDGTDDDRRALAAFLAGEAGR